MVKAALRLSLTPLLLGALACAHTPPEQARVSEVGLVYYQESYGQCRLSFRELSTTLVARHPGAEITVLPVPTERGSDLTIDALYVPAPDPRALLLLTSGIHGVEGFTGSAVQQLFLNEFITGYLDQGVSVLVVHAINPYGFRYLRRVTEHNVDLNRNFSHDDALHDSLNEGYVEVEGLLNPKKKVSMLGEDVVFPLKAIFNIALKGMANLRQAVLQGQYEFPKGLYFGGERAEPQRDLLQPLFEEKIRDHDKILLVDLHTGFGERGKLHFFPNPVKEPERVQAMKQIFKGHEIDFGDSDDFYTVTGAFSDFVAALAPREKIFVPMTFEWGTLDSQTTMGSIKSIHNMILENQGQQFGYSSEADRREAQRRFREMYYPSSPRWRARVMEQARDQFSVLAKRLTAL